TEILHRTCFEQVFEAEVQASYTDTRNFSEPIGADWLMGVGMDIVLGTSDMPGQDGFAFASAMTRIIMRVAGEQECRSHLLNLAHRKRIPFKGFEMRC